MLAGISALTLATLVPIASLVVAAIAAVIVSSRVKGSKDSIDILASANQGLREANEDLVKQCVDQKHDFDMKLLEERADCQRQLGEIRGQLTVLTGTFGKDIAKAVADAIREAS